MEGFIGLADIRRLAQEAIDGTYAQVQRRLRIASGDVTPPEQKRITALRDSIAPHMLDYIATESLHRDPAAVTEQLVIDQLKAYEFTFHLEYGGGEGAAIRDLPDGRYFILMGDDERHSPAPHHTRFHAEFRTFDDN